MAAESVFEGLVSLVLEDGVSGPMAALTEAVNRSLEQLRTAGSATVGGDIFAPMELGGDKLIATITKVKESIAELTGSGAVPAGSPLAAQVAAADELIAALENLRVAQQQTQLSAITGQERVTQAVVGTAEASKVATTSAVTGQNEVTAALDKNIVAAERLNAIYGSQRSVAGNPLLAGGGNEGAIYQAQAQVGRASDDPARVEAAFLRAENAERELTAAQAEIKNLQGGRQGTGTLAGDKVQNASLEEETNRRISSAQAVVTSETKLNAAQEQLVAAEARQAVVFAGTSAETEEGVAKIAASQSAVDRANLNLARAQNEAALKQTDLSGVDQSASYKVQAAQTEKAIADSKYKILQASDQGYVSEIEMNAARLKTLGAEEKLSAVMDAEAKAAAGSGGGGGGVNAGNAVAYFAMYQAFSFGITAIQGIKTSTEEYTLAVNQLSIAMGTNYDAASKQAAGYQATGQALATPGPVAVNAATQFGRLFNQTGVGSPAMAIGAELGSTITLLEAKSAKDGEEEALVKQKLADLGAIAQNYGLGAQGAQDIYSAATLIAQHYGQAQGGSLLGGTAQIADLLKSSGFSPEQGLALVGAVQQYSGMTSEAVAGDLKRLMGRSGSGTFTSLFAEYGVNLNLSLKDQLSQLSAVFKTLPQGGHEQAAIISTLGGGRSGSAALNLIENFPEVLATALKGAADPLAAQKQGQLKLDTFAGQFEKLQHDLTNLGIAIGTSGLLAPLGLLLKGLDPVVVGLTDFVKALNSVPAPLQILGYGLALLAAQAKFGGGVAGATNVLSKVGPGTSLFASAPVEEKKLTGTAANTAALDANSAAMARHTAVLSGEAGAEATATTADDRRAAAIEASTAATARGTAAVDAWATAVDRESLAMEELAAVQADVTATAQELSLAEGEVAAASQAQVAASAEITLAREAEATAAAALVAAEVPVIAETAGVAAGMLGLAGAAVGAVVAMAPLIAIIGGIMAIGKAQSNNDLIEGAISQGAGAAALGTAGIAEGGTAGRDKLTQGIAALDSVQRKLDAVRNDKVGQAEVGLGGGGAAQDAADAATAAERAKLVAAKAVIEAQIKAAGADAKGSDFFGSDYSNVDQGIKQIVVNRLSAAATSKQMLDLLAHTTNDLNLAKAVTPEKGQAGLADAIKPLLGAISKEQDPNQKLSDYTELQKLVAGYSARAKASKDPSLIGAMADIKDTIDKPLYETVVSYVNSRIASIKALEGNTAKADADIRAVLTTGLTRVAAGGDVNATIALIGVMDKNFLNKYNANVAAEEAVLEEQARTLAAAEAAATAALTTLVPGNYNERQIQAIKTRDAAGKNAAAIAQDKTIQATIAIATPLSAPSGSAFKEPKQAKATGPTAAQIEEARLAAQAIPGDPLSAAIANLNVAQYKMGEPKNQVEYWQAYKALHEAQYAYAQAVISAASDARQLGQDLTNPLIVAREKVTEAANLLVFDKGRGALPDVVNKDRLALKQATSAAEKTAFDQKFSDESTNYNLQRISLSAYLSYLNSQHNYLTAVRVKTRQQVDELNQVDQALKGLASSLQGQFNLGDIKIPSVYEARTAAAGRTSVNNVQITINGTDLQAVTAILGQYVGQGAMATVGSAPRKV